MGWLTPRIMAGFQMADRNVTTSLLRSITFSLAASLLLIMHASTARADHASCMEKAKSYFAEIVQLLSKEKNWIMPFVELNERYSPLEDCDPDLLLQEATQTRLIQPILYNRTRSTILFASGAMTSRFISRITP